MLKLWVLIPFIAMCTRCSIMWYKVSKWLAAGRWFSLGTPVSSNNKTDHKGYPDNNVFADSLVENIRKKTIEIALLSRFLRSTLRLWCLILLSTIFQLCRGLKYELWNVNSIRRNGWYIICNIWKMYNGKTKAVSFVIDLVDSWTFVSNIR
jgi:hypothetical protein